MTLRRISAGFNLKRGFSPQTLDEVQREASRLMDDVKVPSTQRLAAAMVIEELCTNIMEHSRATWLEIGVTYSGQGLFLSFADDGLPFDPSPLLKQIPSSARLKSSVDRHLGLYMISSLSRGFEYFRDELGVNIMQLEIIPESG